MAKVIKRKGEKRTLESQEMWREEIKVKGVGTIPVVVTLPDTMKVRDSYIDALKVWRQIPDQPNAQDRVVKFYMERGSSLQAALNQARLFYENELNILAQNITLVALVNDIFEVEPTGVHFVQGITNLHIDEDYWNDTEENARREASWIPPLPSKNPNHPTEQKIALLDMITRKSPEFAQALGEALVNFYEFSASWKGSSEEVDENGFHDAGLGTDTLTEISAVSAEPA